MESPNRSLISTDLVIKLPQFPKFELVLATVTFWLRREEIKDFKKFDIPAT